MAITYPKGFAFFIGTEVIIAPGGEQGRIVGRAEYEADENRYFVRYINGMGCFTEAWLAESSLKEKSA